MEFEILAWATRAQRGERRDTLPSLRGAVMTWVRTWVGLAFSPLGGGSC